jgi:hypothetical protein
MRRIVLLLASIAVALLLASGVALADHLANTVQCPTAIEQGNGVCSAIFLPFLPLASLPVDDLLVAGKPMLLLLITDHSPLHNRALLSPKVDSSSKEKNHTWLSA